MPDDDVTTYGRQMFLISLILAKRYRYGDEFDNEYWSQVLNCPLDQLNYIEK